MRKIIFLDVDGVLNSEKSIVETYMFRKENNLPKGATDEVFPDEYLLNLKDLIDKTGAFIVISSTWRRHYPNDRKWNKLIANLKKYNLDTKIIDSTPILYKQRGEEIREWLSKNPDVTNFVIIDDDSDMCEFTNTHLAKCSWKTGFIEDVKNKALEILNKN